MARQEDNVYGLMGGLPPGGYIPPAAATLASGLAGVSAQQSALQQQMAQQEEQRQRELIAQRQTVGQNLLTFGEKFYNPKMAAQGAKTLLGKEAPTEDTFRTYMQKKARQEALSSLSPLLTKGSGLSATTRQQLVANALKTDPTAVAAPVAPTEPGATIQREQAVPVPGLQISPSPEMKDTVPPAQAAQPGLMSAAQPAALPAAPAIAPPAASGQESPLMLDGVPLTFEQASEFEDQAAKITARAASNVDWFRKSIGTGVIASGPQAQEALNALTRGEVEIQQKLFSGDIMGALSIMQDLNTLIEPIRVQRETAAPPAAGRTPVFEGGFIFDKVVKLNDDGSYTVSLKKVGEVGQTGAQRRAEARAEKQVNIAAGNLSLAISRFDTEKDKQAIAFLGQRFPKLNIPDATVTAELEKDIKARYPDIAGGLRGDTTEQNEAARKLAELVNNPIQRQAMKSKLVRQRMGSLTKPQQAALTTWLMKNGYARELVEGVKEQRGVLGTGSSGGRVPAPPSSGPARAF